MSAGMSAGAKPRTPTSPSERAGAWSAHIGSVWRSPMTGIAPAAGRVRVRLLPACAAMIRSLARATFWGSAAALAWTQVGYGLFLSALRRARGNSRVAPAGNAGTPRVAFMVAAYGEEDVIAAKVADALALDWPRDRLEVVVAVDGGADAGADHTAQLARAGRGHPGPPAARGGEGGGGG